ncbi:hypothetical protein H311_04617, partial [Anncaliia algerae PRA109]
MNSYIQSEESVKKSGRIEELEMSISKLNITEQVEFEYDLPGTKIRLKRKYPYLDDINNQDVKKWLISMQELVKQMQWDQNTSIKVIKGMIRDERIICKENYQSYEDIIAHIKKQTYIQDDAIIYLERLLRIKQKNYVWLENYVKEIQENVENYALSNNLTKKEMKRKFEESFMYGLATEVKIEMKKLNLSKSKTIIKHITDIEKILKEDMKTKQLNKSNNGETIYKNQRTERIQAYDKFNPKNLSKKWCKIHQTSTHDLKECRNSRHAS